MIRIPVHASRNYEVLIERGLAAKTGELAAELVRGRHAVIVSETNVAPLHLETVKNSLEKSGFCIDTFIFQAGEESKSVKTYLELIGFLADHSVTRTDAVFALGGGVTGDLAGFASATYLRGVPCIQIPTTLLSCVDSSVGGKTAVDLPQGKNLLGAFSQPRVVICDPELLETLPENVFNDGCAEVIKYGFIGNRELLENLEKTHVRDQMEYVISECVRMKRDIVEEDEFDTGSRRLLNLGHTFGHAVEKLSMFETSHGSAVAIGMMMMAKSANRQGLCGPDIADTLNRLLVKYHLPMTAPYSSLEIAQAAGMDKKRMGAEIGLIVPCELGRSEVRKVQVSELETWVKAGMEE